MKRSVSTLIMTAVLACGLVAGSTSAAAAGRADLTHARHATVHTSHHRQARHVAAPSKHAAKVHRKHRTLKHDNARRTTKPVPTCPGLGKIHAYQVWTDHYGDHTRFMNRLICDAADYSTVEVKMYFISDDPGPAHDFLRAAALMHRYHHVRFRFLTDVFHAGRAVRDRLRIDRRETPGALWYGCSYGCESPRADAISHSKFITVSRLRTTGHSAVFTTSTNISGEQLVGQVESGVLTSANPGLYHAFTRKFAHYVSCARVRCASAATPHGWQQYASAAVFFAPNSADPITDDLLGLDCSAGGTIDIASLWLTSSALVHALDKNVAQGCTVHVVLEMPERNWTIAQRFSARAMREHDKFLIVTTPKVRRVYEGSQDFGAKALAVNDNEMIRTSNPRVVSAYLGEFAWQWRHSATAHPVRNGIVGVS